MARFTITINATLNGKTCKNPQIEFIQGSDVIYPCEISGNQITIETLPGTNPNACIEGYIKCDDDCLNCPPQYFKKCLCNDVTLLNSCQICKDGLIEEICTPEEIAAGKICSPNGCICPPDKPVTDPNTGQCVECITGTVQGCKICVAGQWTTLECGPNERCVDGECQCTPPYVKDPVTGECKLQDECLDDADCPTCQTCISGKCEPVKCPEGFQCINDECVPACTNVNCNNGADCGENCGCLDGKCVPCTILSCLDEASCQAALGCKCNGDKCTPVQDCNQNCEDNPCVDPNCTCYNGECVSCENFPCVETEGGCNSYYNCQCNDQGKCEGGKDCEDTFELKKKEVCSADGCELEAVYNTKNKCMCDPIEFRVKNTEDCLTQDPTGTGESLAGDTLLRLSIEMFKKGIAYANFKTSDKFSDNEIVTGSIKVVVNAGGVTLPAITSTITANNIVPSINIEKPQSLPANNKKVKVSVFTESIKVNDNNCTNYDNKEIATYEFDLAQSASIYCAKQNQYKTAQIFKLEDSVSTKKPLIVWYRTSGTDFGTTPVSLMSTDYAAKGYFRKKYLTGVAGSFSDKISKPEEGLLNNFRYKTTIDCGCEGANVATTGDVVIYCCPKDWTIVPDGNSCGKKVTIKAFTNCSVNNPFLDSAKYPLQSITNYFISINGKAPKKLDVYANEDIVLTETEPIKSLAFYQGYAGSTSKPPVVTKACEKSYNFNPVLPDFTVNTSLACTDGIITVELPSTGPAPASSNPVTLKLTTYDPILNLKPTSNPRIFTTVDSGPNGGASNAEIATEIKKSNTAKVTVNFAGGCTNMKEISYTCAGRIDTDAEPNAYAKGTCPGGGDNPKIVVTPSGFGDNVVYSLNGGAFQSSNEFLNVPAGTYTVTAKETVNGIESIATSNITIEAPVVPDAYFSPGSICTGGSSTLIITGAPGSVFNIYGPNNQLITTITFQPDQGTVLVPGFTEPGNYTVSLGNVKPNNSCTVFSKTLTLSVGGAQLTPQIEIQPGTYCVGQPVPFRIVDGGANAIYNVSSLGTGTVTSPLQANQFAYNGVFTPSSTTGFIQITGVDGTCNTTTNPQVTVTSLAAPIISSATAICQVNNQHTVTVVATGATGVTIGGVAATNTSTNTWQRTNITGLTEVQVVVANGSCNVTQTVQLQNCLCPQGSVFVESGGDTCGQGLTTVFYNGVSGITPNSSWTYVFQNLAPLTQQWGNVGVSATFNPLSTPSLSVPTTVGVVDTYRLKLVNTTNGCEYFSDSVTVTAIQPPLNVTITPSIPSPALTGQTVTFSTIQGDYTYTWSGAVNGSTYQSNSITFNTPGTYTINVQVCSALGCCVTQTLSYVVGQNCTNPPIVTASTPVYTNSCADIQVNHQLGSGTGAITYTVTSTYVNISSTAVPPNGIIIIPTSAVPAGVTDSFTITLTDNNGCTGSTVVSYQRCQYSAPTTLTGMSITSAQCSSFSQFKLTILRKLGLPCGYNMTDLKFKLYLDSGSGDVEVIEQDLTLILSPFNQQCSYQISDSNYNLSPTNPTHVPFFGTTSTVSGEYVVDGVSAGVEVIGTVTIPASCP